MAESYCVSPIGQNGQGSASGRRTTFRVLCETLASCHLNLLQTDPDLPPTYSLTEPSTEQRDLLKVLRMGDLVDAEEIAPRIQPRAPPRVSRCIYRLRECPTISAES